MKRSLLTLLVTLMSVMGVIGCNATDSSSQQNASRIPSEALQDTPDVVVSMGKTEGGFIETSPETKEILQTRYASNDYPNGWTISWGNYARTNSIGNKDMRTKPQEKWACEVDKNISSYSNMVYYDGDIFVGSYGRNIKGTLTEFGNYCSIDAEAGKVNWKFRVRGSIGGPSCIERGIAYFFVDRENAIYALDIATQTVLWKFNLNDPLSGNLLIENGLMYFGTNKGEYYALDLANVKVLWRRQLPVASFTAAVVYNNHILVGTGPEPLIYAIDKETGLVSWNFRSTGGLPAWGGSLVGDIYCFGTMTLGGGSMTANKYYGIKADTGEYLWEKVLRLSTVNIGVIYKDLVIHGTQEGVVHAYDVTNGDVRWEVKFPGALSTSITLSGSTLFFPTDRSVIAMDAATGEQLWEIELEQKPLGAVLVIDGTLYVYTSKDGCIRAFE